MKRGSWLLAAAVMALAVPSLAGTAADSLSVFDPYVRLVPPGQPNSAAFMRIQNAGARPYRLVRAESPAAEIVELHTHIHEDGAMKMRPVKEITVPARGEVALEPGGLHIMLIQLKRPLKEGETAPLTLVFDDGSRKTVQAAVRHPAARGHDVHHHH